MGCNVRRNGRCGRASEARPQGDGTRETARATPVGLTKRPQPAGTAGAPGEDDEDPAMTRERTETTTEGTAPTREVVLIARRRVLAARAQYRAGTLTLDELYAVVDRYIAATQARAK